MRYLLIIYCFLFSVLSHALSLREDAPDRYVVRSGDSLWEIATRYLQDPWEWKALWRANPGIKNPNRIYPGMVIALDEQGHKPYLKVLSNGTVKLSPNMYAKPNKKSIPPIPLSDIRPFLNPSLVLDEDLLEQAPFVVAFDPGHLMAGQGDEIYVQGLSLSPKLSPGHTVSYALFRPEGEYHDPKTKALLGYKTTLVGYAELLHRTDPAKVVVTDIMKGVKLGDRVVPNTKSFFELYFEPKAPAKPVNGTIIDFPGEFVRGATGLVAVLDRGKDVGLEPGDVLAVNSPGRVVKSPRFPPRFVRLPPERIGEVMVFRTFTHTSFALVVRSIRAVKEKDVVTNP